MKTYLIELTGR